MKKKTVLIVFFLLVISSSILIACTPDDAGEESAQEEELPKEDIDKFTETLPPPTDAPTVEPTYTLTLIPTVTNTPTITPIPTLVPPEVVFIPAGEFRMGSDISGRDDEAPEHKVYLDDYWIYKYEVTNAQYRDCIEADVCVGNIAHYPSDNYPAVYITWQEANDYCQWVGGRLPTEAEFEKAARGEESHYPYPWGDEEINCNLVTAMGCIDDFVPVGSYPEGASPYGAMDLVGNVIEWVADWYDPDYYKSSPMNNPLGPENNAGKGRVVRGGMWYHGNFTLTVTLRYNWSPEGQDKWLGFRCAFSEAP